jgi:hypothetical protein
MDDRLEEIRERVTAQQTCDPKTFWARGELAWSDDAGFLLGEVTRLRGQLTVAQTFSDTWQEHAEAHRATLEQVAELVQQWRAKGAQADFLGVVNVWDDAADQLAKVLAEEDA